MSLINPKTISGAVHIAATDASFSAPTNQLIFGTGINTTISINTPTAARSYSIIDVGADAQFLMSEGTQTINGTKNFNIICATQVNIGTTTPAVGYILYSKGKARITDTLTVDNSILTSSIEPLTTTINIGTGTPGSTITVINLVATSVKAGNVSTSLNTISTTGMDLNISTTTSGNVSITPTGVIQLGAETRLITGLGARRLVLYNANVDNYQYIGFATSATEMQYYATSTSYDHVFYVGTSSTTSSELVRIKGTGGITAPGNFSITSGSGASGNMSINATGLGSTITLQTGGGNIVLANTTTVSAGMFLANSTTGYLPDKLDYYEGNTGVNITFSGPWASTITWRFTRIGSIVVARFPDMIGTAIATSVLTAAAGSIPARFCPASIYRGTTIAENSGANTVTPCGADVKPDGSITFYKNASDTAWNSGGAAGPYGTCWSWVVI